MLLFNLPVLEKEMSPRTWHSIEEYPNNKGIFCYCRLFSFYCNKLYSRLQRTIIHFHRLSPPSKRGQRGNFCWGSSPKAVDPCYPTISPPEARLLLSHHSSISPFSLFRYDIDLLGSLKAKHHSYLIVLMHADPDPVSNFEKMRDHRCQWHKV